MFARRSRWRRPYRARCCLSSGLVAAYRPGSLLPIVKTNSDGQAKSKGALQRTDLPHLRPGRQTASNFRGKKGGKFFYLKGLLCSCRDLRLQEENFLLMRFLPVFLDVTQGIVGLIGSGPAALAKLRLLQSAGGKVRWYVEQIDTHELARDVQSALLEICSDDPRAADFSDLIAIVSAAGEPWDADIAARARAYVVPI